MHLHTTVGANLSAVEILAFYEIQDGRRAPSLIRRGRHGTTHEGAFLVLSLYKI